MLCSVTSHTVWRKGDHSITLKHGKCNKQAAQRYKDTLITLHKTDATDAFKG